LSGRAYLSIGDVLTLLRQEFPDVTISKIRFLESQGLVNPERTPSGYRKFYEPDVERLRWVLRQQREHFLPLKVIKGRLEEVGEKQGNGHSHDRPARAAGPTAAAAGPTAERGATLPGMGASAVAERGPAARTAVAERSRPPGAPPGAGPRVAGGSGSRPSGPRHAEPDDAPSATTATAEAAPGQPASSGRHRAKAAKPAPVVLAEGEMTADELAAASGCSAAALASLESYGLVGGRQIGGVTYYGEDALAVARLASAFAGFGVEPRHLRLHKHAAEREAGFVEQIVLPLLKQRNPESRQRAHDTVEELSRLGQELRALLLARTLRDQLGG
jgi:DNA-binding transcriptional MerR regulator